MSKIRPYVKNLENWLIETRRDIHQHPELGYQEYRTSELVAETLKNLGLNVKKGLGRTGVVGVWESDEPGKCIGLRADMDALGMDEPSNKDYASVNKGVMHACGHDCHTAMLMGVARALSENPDLRKTLKGSVKLIFQPAEEGGGGAGAMIADGVLDAPPMDAVFALHVVPILKVGQLGFASGVGMAAVDNFEVTIKGRGGHAAHPDLAADPIEPAAEFIRRLKRDAGKIDRALIAVCTFSSGTRVNIIPDRAVLSGTMRALSNEARKAAGDLVKKTAADMEKETGLKFSLKLEHSYPMLVNDDAMLDFMLHTAGDLLGPENLIPQGPSFGAEDMAYFLQKIPGAHAWIGCGKEESKPVAMLHSPEFDPDEGVLPVGVELMVRMIESFLGGNSD